MIKIFISLVAVVALVGCASAPVEKRYIASSQVVNFPQVGIESEAEIGQTLVSKANLQVSKAIVIRADIAERKIESIVNNRWSGVITIPAGKLVKSSENSEGAFYRSLQGYYDGTTGRPKNPVGIFVPNDPKQPAVAYVYHYAGDSTYAFGEQPVTYTDTTSETWSKDSFKSELVYGGLSQKTISVSYREFVDGTARPAFSQEIKYDLNDSDIIGFRGARFQVIKATNSNIKYKMLKPLD